MNPDCQKYLEDPDANAAHLATCAECRAVDDALRASSASGPDVRSSVTPNALPLAAWEGATYRSWPLVVAGAVAIAVIAALLFAATGTSPLDIVRGNVPSSHVIASMFRLAGGAVQNAPVSWQIGIAISFLIVNAIFIALLRRSPRGVDV